MELDVYEDVKKKIESILGINLDAYKDVQMRRRLNAWLVRTGAPGWDEYFRRVRQDENEFLKFRNYITINVTEFFRDKDKWDHLKNVILPDLLKANHPGRGLNEGLRIWSAGCSIGAEPYSLSIILEEIARGRQHYILASDLDRGALAKARSGGPYLAEELKNISDDRRVLNLKAGGPPYFIDPKIVQKITFKEHNLLCDPYEKNFDLIVCRNVVIYFTAEAKDHIFKNFHNALRPGGILFLGGTEIIPRPQEIGFASNGISFYRRITS